MNFTEFLQMPPHTMLTGSELNHRTLLYKSRWQLTKAKLTTPEGRAVSLLEKSLAQTSFFDNVDQYRQFYNGAVVARDSLRGFYLSQSRLKARRTKELLTDKVKQQMATV
ncbi:unnamed protein product [Umbelopsis ramanniana]